MIAFTRRMIAAFVLIDALASLVVLANTRGWLWVPLACFYVGMPLMALLWEEVHRLAGLRALWLIAAPVVAEVVVGLLYNNDLALILAAQHDGGATLPYSPLWFLLNPFWSLPVSTTDPLNPLLQPLTNLSAHAYLWYLLAWQLGSLFLMLRMPRRFSLRYAYWAQVLNVMLVVVHNPQSIVPAQFLYMAPVSAAFVLLAALVKLPIGWSWNLSDGHWACLSGKITQNYGLYHVACGHFLYGIVDVSGEPSLSYNFMVYFTMAVVVLLVLRYWWGLGQHALRIPLPGGYAIVFKANKGALALGVALWRDQR